MVLLNLLQRQPHREGTTPRNVAPKHGFMQQHIFASHTCFGGHMDVDCSATLQTLNVSNDLKWATNAHVT